MTVVGDLLVEFRERPSGRNHPPVLTLTERNGFVRQADRFHKRLATEDTSSYRLVRRDDIAFNPYLLWAGAVAQNTIVDEGIISPLYPTFRVRPGNDAGYVARLLLSPQLIGAYDGIAFGSVPRRRRSSTKDFLDLPLNGVPPLPEQRRIAAILDHVDALRAKRRQVLAHLDTLTQAIFHDMFGRTEDHWQTVHLRDVVAQIDSGTSPVCEARPATLGEWGVLKLGAVTYGTFNARENKAFLGDASSMRSNEVHVGDVLMSRKNTRELVGAVAVVNQVRPHLLLPDLIFRLRLADDRVDRYFFQALLMGPLRHRVRALSSGSAASMPNISKARLQGLPLPLPPLNLQHRFARRLRQVEKMREATSHTELVQRDLFASLQSRAFRGEL